MQLRTALGELRDDIEQELDTAFCIVIVTCNLLLGTWPKMNWTRRRRGRTSGWRSFPSSASSRSSSTSSSRTRCPSSGCGERVVLTPAHNKIIEQLTRRWKRRVQKSMFQVFSKQLVEKVRELDYQKNQTEKAFHGFLPPSLVRDMKHDQVGEIKLKSDPTVFSSFLYNIKYFFSI